MEEGKFRRDLYFRLNAIHLEIPPLRRRRHDIPVLVEHFVSQHNARYGTRKRFSPAAAKVLSAYSWPGNVRQLRHVVERSAVLADSEVIEPGDLPAEVHEAGLGLDASPGPGTRLAEIERRHIARVLREVRGHRARAALLLGISERNLYRKIREYQLEDDARRDGEG